jgi:hypothetical protein
MDGQVGIREKNSAFMAAYDLPRFVPGFLSSPDRKQVMPVRRKYRGNLTRPGVGGPNMRV